MKKIILSATLILLKIAGFSQGYIAPELGWSSKNTWYVAMKGGYQINKFFTEGSILAQMNQTDAAYFGLGTGYAIDLDFVSVEPALALNYRLVSTDKKSLNGFVPSASVKFVLNNYVYLSTNYIDKTLLVGIGLKCVL